MHNKKNNTARYFLLITVLVLITGCGKNVGRGLSKQRIDELPNFIIFIIAGVRNKETIDDEAKQYMPHLFNDLAHEGTLYTDLKDTNYEFHLPQFYSILTGKKYSYLNHELQTPSLFQYIRKQHRLPRHKMWSIGNGYSEDCYLLTWKYSKATCPAQLIAKARHNQ